MRPAMHLYITHALYFEICTTLLEVIQLMSIAGYEAYVCMCFFMYKTLCAAFIWLRGTPVVASMCVYTARKQYLIHKLLLQKSTGTRTKNIIKKRTKRTDTRGLGISSMMKSIYLLTTTPTSHTHRFYPLPLATPASCSPHLLATPIHSTHSP